MLTADTQPMQPHRRSHYHQSSLWRQQVEIGRYHLLEVFTTPPASASFFHRAPQGQSSEKKIPPSEPYLEIASSCAGSLGQGKVCMLRRQRTCFNYEYISKSLIIILRAPLGTLTTMKSRRTKTGIRQEETKLFALFGPHSRASIATKL